MYNGENTSSVLCLLTKTRAKNVAMEGVLVVLRTSHGSTSPPSERLGISGDFVYLFPGKTTLNTEVFEFVNTGSSLRKEE